MRQIGDLTPEQESQARLGERFCYHGCNAPGDDAQFPYEAPQLCELRTVGKTGESYLLCSYCGPVEFSETVKA